MIWVLIVSFSHPPHPSFGSKERAGRSSPGARRGRERESMADEKTESHTASQVRAWYKQWYLKIWEVKDLVKDELVFCEKKGMVLHPRTETEREREEREERVEKEEREEREAKNAEAKEAKEEEAEERNEATSAWHEQQWKDEYGSG